MRSRIALYYQWREFSVPNFRARMPTGPRNGLQRSSWSKRRKRASDNGEGERQAASISQLFSNALVIQSSPSVFDMSSSSEREQLAHAMWSEDSLLGDDALSRCSVDLATILHAIIFNDSRRLDLDSEEGATRDDLRVEGLMINIQRALSQRMMPLLTARISCVCLRAHLPRQVWQLISVLCPGLLASYSWTETFMKLARALRPPCKYETLPRVAGVMFDNYSRKVLYSSKVTVENHGFMLHMTNWATVQIPRHIAPQNFDAHQSCELLMPVLLSTCVQAAMGCPSERRAKSFQIRLYGILHFIIHAQ